MVGFLAESSGVEKKVGHYQAPSFNWQQINGTLTALIANLQY
jgi:hypothetical protein